MNKFFLILASLPMVASAADTVGSRLDAMLDLKARTELTRQENALREEMMRTGGLTLPSIVSISGSSSNLVARLQVSTGSQRVFSVGDHVGNGYNIVFIKPDEVLVAKQASKGAPLKLISLSFAQPDTTLASGRPSVPPQAQFPGVGPAAAIPPLPTVFSVAPPAPAAPAK
ncbi:hypothetical protein [Paucibacter soli]|uniref:hypothetical protein n=1 Tax=Paucibacter soli TaxID=3133433 RepID=UPI00309EF436